MNACRGLVVGVLAPRALVGLDLNVVTTGDAVVATG